MVEKVEIGNATLYRGDSLEILQEIEEFDAVITDPPYSSGARRDADKQVRGAMLRSMDDADWFSSDAMTTWGFNWFIRGAFSTIRGKLASGSHLYVFIDWRQTPNVYGMLESCGFRVNHCLVWAKTHFGMGQYWRNQHENIVFASLGTPTAMLNRGMGSVLTCANVSPQCRVHPTEKPVLLLRKMIDATPGRVILDPFMGSGSTGVAALESGRKFIGIELDPRHFDTACKRMESVLAQPSLLPAA